MSRLLGISVAFWKASGGRRAGSGEIGNDWFVLAVFGAALGLYGWVVFVSEFWSDGLVGPRYNALGTDYMVYYTAGRAWMSGSGSLLSDSVALTETINHHFSAWLRGPLPLHPWLYPPPFLLLVLPFATLPFMASYLAFQVASFAALLAGAWCWRPAGMRRATVAVLAAVAPAASVNAICGQNAFLTLALLLGGFGVRERRPFTGGLILGLLCYKPQFALMVPIALVALRDWRCLAGAAAGAAAAAILSLALLGTAPWSAWLGVLAGGQNPTYAAWLDAGRLWGLSVWATARALGLPEGLARAFQDAASVLAGCAVYRSFRTSRGSRRSVALLLCAVLIAAPHVSPYDFLLLDGSVLLLLSEAAPPVRRSLLIICWAAPMLGVPQWSVLGFITPAATLSLLAALAFQSSRNLRESRDGPGGCYAPRVERA